MEQSVPVEMKIAAHYKISRANAGFCADSCCIAWVKEGG
jgi:hypothetical protein